MSSGIRKSVRLAAAVLGSTCFPMLSLVTRQFCDLVHEGPANPTWSVVDGAPSSNRSNVFTLPKL